MHRSFTNRVFAGVCGGLGETLHVNAWIVRLVFIILSIASLGMFAALYLLLWWLTPQQSLATRRRGMPFLVVILLIVLTATAWAGHTFGYLTTPEGVSLYLPGMLVVLSAVFFLKQLAR